MKVRNKRRMNRGLSLLLTGALTAGMLSGMPSLAEEAGAELDKELWTPPAETEEAAPLNTAGDLSLEELATAELAAEDIPEAVSLAEVEAKGHVHRLREQETDLNTVIFQNRDGTKTLYYFGENVKYEDETGRIRDKKNTLEEYMPKARYVADYSYVNSANDIQTYFPKTLDLETGVVLEYDGIRIEVSPDHALVKNPEAAEEAGATDSTDGQAPVTGETAASTGTSSETTEQTADESTAGTRVTGEAEIAGTSGETAVTQPEKAMEETAPAQTGVTLPSGRADDTGRRTEATVQAQGTLTTEQPKEMIEVAPTVGEAVGEESRPTAVIPEQAEVQDGQLSEHITVETVQPEPKPYVPRKLRVEAQSAEIEKLTEMVDERPSETVEYVGNRVV